MRDSAPANDKSYRLWDIAATTFRFRASPASQPDHLEGSEAEILDYLRAHPDVEVIYKECNIAEASARLARRGLDVVVAPPEAGDPSWRRLSLYRDRVRYLSLPEPGNLALLIRQHAAIAQAVLAADPAKAETVMRAHLREVLRYIEHKHAQEPDLFE